jgi:hypothetical protein
MQSSFGECVAALVKHQLHVVLMKLADTAVVTAHAVAVTKEA